MKALLASAPRLFSRESRLRRLLRDRFVSLILTLRWGALRISCFIGIAAGLSSADDAGRRYLIRVTAAVQFAVFPAWFGCQLCTDLVRASLSWNASGLSRLMWPRSRYGGDRLRLMRLRREDVQRFTEHTRMHG